MVGLFTNWQEVLSASNVKMANVAYIEGTPKKYGQKVGLKLMKKMECQ